MRTFKTITGSLRLMREWLLEHGVQIAAMASTSAYWKRVFYLLEEWLEAWQQLMGARTRRRCGGR